MLTSQFAGSHIGLLGKGPNLVREKKLLLLAMACAAAAVFAVGVRGEAGEEVGGWRSGWGWKAGQPWRYLKRFAGISYGFLRSKAVWLAFRVEEMSG
jgi:hypothetical protein